MLSTLISNIGGHEPLLYAAIHGHDAGVKSLTEREDVISDSRDDGYRKAPHGPLQRGMMEWRSSPSLMRSQDLGSKTPRGELR